MAQQTVDGLPDHFDHIHLRGAAAYSTVPYAALNILLAELDEETARSPLLVLGALQRRFDGSDSGRRTLMHVDGVEEFDNLSAAVISHLARLGAVRLLITCKDVMRAPGAFVELWQDGLLDRFDVQPLGLDATTELLCNALEAPVSRSAVRELWAASGGNLRYLQQVTRADVASGQLFVRDGVWVVRHVPRRAAPTVDDFSLLELAALSPGDRAVIEVLAVAGHLPATILLQAVRAASLDALQTSGMLRLHGGDVPLIGLCYDVLADVVHNQSVSAAGRQALERVNRLRDKPEIPVRARTALAAWALTHGMRPTDAELVDLARQANDHGLDDMASRFLDALPARRTTPGAVIERARRSWIDGSVADALAAVEPLMVPGPADDIGLCEWVDARVLASRLLARTHGREGEAESLLDDVSAHLRHGTGAHEDLRRKLALARSQAHMFEGEFARVDEQAEELLGSRGASTRWNVRIRSVHGMAEASRGAQNQAVRTMESVVARLADAPSDPLEHETASLCLLSGLFLAGSWEECLHLLGEWSDQPTTPYCGGSLLDVAEGVLLAFLGRSSEARVRLVPAISQLRVRDRQGLLPLAEAAAAYSCVLDGTPDGARDHLRAIDLTARRYSWSLREAVLYFRLLTQAWLESTDVVSTEFLEHARHLGDLGNRGAELFFLCQAVQLGRHEAADSLAATALASEGRFSRLAEKVAKGLSSRDPGALRQVALEALELGNHNLAGDLASLSIDHLAETDDPMIGVQAEQILRKTSTPARRHVRRKLLSQRERAIARQVALGVANRQIADQEHLSTRTVEGHVHRIMSKLGLSSRKQLALIFGRQR
ncbi:helix-turn-helix transcriptional regulator [uncultured Arthrobacter sp.]|uniref:helix-turn-helix transcriptional regulator n=1 Tax=uncultured Arthrobacter sp. TaxID=114050 RepID=UPI00260F22F6|nr:helix-turn-helix transcriptional regulator [uncultured Arthrobacter sp.]